ncbi:MAG: hypothetical protein M3Z54_10510 [Gemmatimonadota bacterium]|nr:hypothetical protein [Gemmatimonadota bacterium]
MKDSPSAVSGLPGDLVSRDDEGLFAFINTLRLSVRAKVAAEQQHGLPLSEIVVQVREMVRLAERDAQQPHAFPSQAYRAISRQAVAWCVEAYRPLIVTGAYDLPLTSSQPTSQPVPLTLAPAGGSPNRHPAQSPNSRGLP